MGNSSCEHIHTQEWLWCCWGFSYLNNERFHWCLQVKWGDCGSPSGRCSDSACRQQDKWFSAPFVWFQVQIHRINTLYTAEASFLPAVILLNYAEFTRKICFIYKNYYNNNEKVQCVKILCNWMVFGMVMSYSKTERRTRFQWGTLFLLIMYCKMTIHFQDVIMLKDVTRACTALLWNVKLNYHGKFHHVFHRLHYVFFIFYYVAIEKLF